MLQVPGRRLTQAASEDLGAVLDLLAEAEQWLQDRGIKQWLPPGRDHARSKIRYGVAEGRTWICRQDGGCVVGTMTFEDADPDYWSEADEPASASYISRLIVARGYAGRGLGEAILDFCPRNVETRTGCSW